MARRASKVDANQPQYVKTLRDCGLSVSVTSGVGHGFPDIIVGGYNRHLGMIDTLPVEIKMPGKEDDLTPDEIEWWHNWKGNGIAGSSDPDEVLRWYGIL